MKTTITTLKGSKVNLSITESQGSIVALVEVAGKKLTSYLQTKGNQVTLGRINGNMAIAEVSNSEMDKIKAFKKEVSKAQEEKKTNDYAFLMEKLPVRNIESGNNDEKAQELLELANKQSFYSSDDEDEGLNLAVQAERERLKSEAYKHCNHDFETTYSYGFTADARKKLTRTMKCKKCGKTVVDSVSEDVSETAMWR